MMTGLFFNPFGFDVVQYWLILLAGDLWSANFIMYCIAGAFFGLSFYFRYQQHKFAKMKNISGE